MRLPAGVRRLFRLPRSPAVAARELDDEVAFHLAMRQRDLERDGMPADAARDEALRRFGDLAGLREYTRNLEERRMQRRRLRERFGSLGQDIRFAARQWRKAPGFHVIAAFTLALGIGAATAIFSVVNGVVLQPLPFPHPQRMVQLWGIDAGGKHLRFADPTFDDLLRTTTSFSALAEYNVAPASIDVRGAVVPVTMSAVSSRFFDVLGVRPALGRFFSPAEEQLDAPVAVVISHELWLHDFGGDRSAIGAKLRDGATTLTVVGVLPAGTAFPAGADIWYPRETFGKNTSYTAHNWRVIGRIRPGISVAQSAADVALQLRRLRASVGDATWTVNGTAIGLRDQVVGNARTLLFLVLGASLVLLLIACANVANLLIARLATRGGEIAIRLAVGAERSRLMQQLFVESSLLALAGCAGGLLLAVAGIDTLLTLRPAMIPRVGEVHADAGVLAFAVVVAAGMAVALGLLAAWRGASGDLHGALAQSQRTQGRGTASYRLRGSLVAAQLAMTIVLLIGAALLTRSFIRLITINPGFRTDGLLVATITVPLDTGVTAQSARVAYQEQLEAHAAAIPGVTAVGISDAAPFSGGSSNGEYLVLSGASQPVTVDDIRRDFRLWTTDRSNSGFASYQLASPGYFTALGIPLLKGRVFDGSDRSDTREVGVVNAAMAHTQWPHGSAIGKVIEFGNIDGDLTPITIVGVVGDTRAGDLAQPPGPAVYLPYRQRSGNSYDVNVMMAVRNEASVIAPARQALRAVRPDLPIRFQTIERIVGRSVANQRFLLLIFAIFGGVALLLATLGVYGVLSYLVAQRSREISVRMALGASRAEVVRLILRQGASLAAIGVVTGTVAAIAATRTLKHLLYGVSTTDFAAFVIVLVVVAGVALLATWLPARRAARIDPMDVLRAG